MSFPATAWQAKGVTNGNAIHVTELDFGDGNGYQAGLSMQNQIVEFVQQFKKDERWRIPTTWADNGARGNSPRAGNVTGPHVPVASAAQSPTGLYTFIIKPYETIIAGDNSSSYKVYCEFQSYFNVQPPTAGGGKLLMTLAEKGGTDLRRGGSVGNGGIRSGKLNAATGNRKSKSIGGNEEAAALNELRDGWNQGWTKLPSVTSKGVCSGGGGGGSGGSGGGKVKVPPPGVRAKLAAAAEKRKLQLEEEEMMRADHLYTVNGSVSTKTAKSGSNGRFAFGSKSSRAGAAAYGGSIDSFLHNAGGAGAGLKHLRQMNISTKPEWDSSLDPLDSHSAPYEQLFTDVEIGLVRPLPSPGHPLLDPNKFGPAHKNWHDRWYVRSPLSPRSRYGCLILSHSMSHSVSHSVR